MGTPISALIHELADQVEDLESEHQDAIETMRDQVEAIDELNILIVSLKNELKHATERIEYYESIYPDLATAVQVKERLEET